MVHAAELLNSEFHQISYCCTTVAERHGNVVIDIFEFKNAGSSAMLEQGENQAVNAGAFIVSKRNWAIQEFYSGA